MVTFPVVQWTMILIKDFRKLTYWLDKEVILAGCQSFVLQNCFTSIHFGCKWYSATFLSLKLYFQRVYVTQNSGCTQIHVFGLYEFWMFQETRSKSGLSILSLKTFSLPPSVCFFKLNIMWFTARRLVLFRFQGCLNDVTVFMLLCIPCLSLSVCGWGIEHAKKWCSDSVNK